MTIIALNRPLLGDRTLQATAVAAAHGRQLKGTAVCVGGQARRNDAVQAMLARCPKQKFMTHRRSVRGIQKADLATQIGGGWG